jgi:hypothetical protein
MTSSRGGKKLGCIAELDDEYIEHMEDVLEIDERPLSVPEPVVCMDEKPVTLHKDVREPIPMKPGSVAKQDNEYERGGTANVFCGIEPKAGVHFTKVTPQPVLAGICGLHSLHRQTLFHGRNHPSGHG